MKRAHNFSAGPAILPLPVLEQAAAELTDYRQTGSSLLEMSHRGKEFIEVDARARETLSRILGLGDEYEVLFLQGGASTQFMMVPYNLLGSGKSADYINTGIWSQKAIKEARRFGTVNVVYSSEEQNFNHVPENEYLHINQDSSYLHFTSNNTIFGTQFPTEPESGKVPLVCDASSDFLSRPIDLKKYGLIYAGAQKNLGPAGVTVVIIRKDLLEASRMDIPTILQYKTHAGAMFNTPPVFAVYMVSLVLGWIEAQGGLTYFETLNTKKARMLYDVIDSDDFYQGTAQPASRSNMNVTFRLSDQTLETEFLKQAEARDLTGLKGHRSVGGIRASIYNACPPESVQALAEFMAEFKSSY